MDIRPDYANLLEEDEIKVVSPDMVPLGATIVVKPGERVPLDGVLSFGESSLDMRALNGESMPHDVNVGDSIISGAINLNSTIHIKTTKEYGESTVKKILDLVENASSKKSKSEAFITKFAKYYTPIVVILALALAIIPPVIYTFLGNYNTWTTWIYRALSFLVVSCPCAFTFLSVSAFPQRILWLRM